MVEKIYTVNFFPSANQDLALIKRYWESVLETPADEFMAEIYYKVKSLEEFPFTHHLSNNPTLREKGYRIFPIRNYYIFYIVLEEEKEVQIHRILYNKMDFTKIL